jgi:hypothetical protein
VRLLSSAKELAPWAERIREIATHSEDTYAVTNNQARSESTLHLAPRERGEVAARSAAGEGRASRRKRRPLSLTISPLRGAARGEGKQLR